MSKLSVDALVKRYQAAEQRRRRWEPRWQEVYDFALPNRDNIYEATPGEDRVADTYDDEAIQAHQDFAGMMHDGLCPPYGEVVLFEPGIRVPPAERDRVADELRGVAEAVHAALHNSNAHDQIAEGIADVGVGTMAMSILPSPDSQLVRFQAWPLSQVYLDPGPFGGVDGVFLVAKMTRGEISAKYPGVTVPQELGGDEKTRHCVVDGTYRDWSEPGQEVYHRHLFVIAGMSHRGAELMYWPYRGKGSNPNIVWRFSTATGEVYGRGPGFNALASIKTVNLSAQLTLENADLAVGGIWKAPHDGVINPNTIQLIPGTVIPYAPGTGGLEAVQSPANFDLSRFLSDEYAVRIRRAYYVEDYEGKGDTPRSSREVAALQAKHFKRMGRPLIRGLTEFVTPMIHRLVYLLKQQNQIELPQVNGRDVGMRIVSPLAKQMKLERVVTKLDAAGAVTSVLGPQQASLFLDGQRIARDIMALYDQPMNYVRNEQQVQQIVEQMGAMLQQQQGAM